MISHPLPRLLLPGTNPVPSARNAFVPFFFCVFFSSPSWEAVNRSYPFGKAQTYTATPPQNVLRAVPRLLDPWGRALRGYLVEGERFCPEMARPWGQVCAVALAMELSSRRGVRETTGGTRDRGGETNSAVITK